MLKKVCFFLILGITVLTALAQEELVASARGVVTPERSLAGITVGKSWDHVIDLYGLPDEIIVGLQAGVAAPTAGFAGMIGAGMPGMQQGARPGMGMPGMMPGAGMPGMMMGPAMMGSGMPGMMGSGMGPMPGMRPAGTASPMGGPVGPQGGAFPLPGIPGAGGIGLTGAAPSPQITVSPDKMLWIYRLKGGITLRVTLAQADGRVVEVTVSGNKWEKARTSKGITLGSHYTDVLKAYGWPEETSTSEGNLFCRYDQSYHVVFGVRGSDKKVISITVTM